VAWLKSRSSDVAPSLIACHAARPSFLPSCSHAFCTEGEVFFSADILNIGKEAPEIEEMTQSWDGRQLGIQLEEESLETSAPYTT
jgi:hypothetical protein